MLDHASFQAPTTTDLQPLRGIGSDCARNVRLLRRCRALGGIEPSDLASLARVAHTRRFVRGDVVLSGASEHAQFAVLASGLTKSVGAGGARGSLTGIIVSLHGPGDALGFERAVADVEAAPYAAESVVALTAGEALIVPVDVLARAMAKHAVTALSVARALVENAQVLRAKITVMSAGSVPQRLATLFVDLADRFGDELEDGRWVVPIALSREDLARLVGTTVESAIRTMRKWERAELVLRDEDGGFVIRDRRALEDLRLADHPSLPVRTGSMTGRERAVD